MKYLVRSGATVEIEIHEEIKYTDTHEDLPRTQYSDVTQWEVVSGDAARQIEVETDGSCTDDYHEYLVLYFANGDTATFRNSYVDMFII